MSNLRFKAEVSEIVQRTSNVTSFRFARPPELSYKAGQYMVVTLNVEGREVRKPFSISSSPTEEDHIEFTKKLTGHPFSKSLSALRVADPVTIEAPFGTFTFEGESEKTGLLSGGVGITPLRSICRFCTDTKLNSRVTLLYGNRTEDDVVFRGELEQMERQNRNFKLVLTLAEPGPDWRGYTGNIDAEMIKREIPDFHETVFYVCGPPGMVLAMEELLNTLAVRPENVKKENFAGYS